MLQNYQFTWVSWAGPARYTQRRIGFYSIPQRLRGQVLRTIRQTPAEELGVTPLAGDEDFFENYATLRGVAAATRLEQDRMSRFKNIRLRLGAKNG